MGQSVQRNKRLIEGRCAVLSGVNHTTVMGQRAQKNSSGERTFSSEHEVSFHLALAQLSLVLLKVFGGDILSIHE